MQKTPPRFTHSEVSISVGKLRRYADEWLNDCLIRQHSNRTIDSRRSMLDKLLWFLAQEELPDCGTGELRRFLAYVTRAHLNPGGRWGNERMTKPVRPRTVKDYHGHLRTFFRWLVAEGVADASPMETITAPVARADQIQPFTIEQVQALLGAAAKSNHPKRDTAILLFMLDTATRASEVCGLLIADLDLQGRRATVRGKGNKSRSVFLSGPTIKALYSYLRDEPRDDDEPIFTSDRGTRAGEPLTRSGLLQLFERLGKSAKIEGVRCSPHTVRHTSSVAFLRAGGNQYALQNMLGHENSAMTARYVNFSQADVAEQHRMHSPVEFLRGRKSR